MVSILVQYSMVQTPQEVSSLQRTTAVHEGLFFFFFFVPSYHSALAVSRLLRLPERDCSGYNSTFKKTAECKGKGAPSLLYIGDDVAVSTTS